MAADALAKAANLFLFISITLVSTNIIIVRTRGASSISNCCSSRRRVHSHLHTEPHFIASDDEITRLSHHASADFQNKCVGHEYSHQTSGAMVFTQLCIFQFIIRDVTATADTLDEQR
jgi:hypothetical protein